KDLSEHCLDLYLSTFLVQFDTVARHYHTSILYPSPHLLVSHLRQDVLVACEWFQRK
ncbi:unnamed protein product, partial [Heterobilharzia americana]